MRLFKRTTCLIRRSVCKSAAQFMIDFLFQISPPDRVECSSYGHHLGEHLSSLTSFVPETFETRCVTGNSCQPLRNVFVYVLLLSSYEMLLSHA